MCSTYLNISKDNQVVWSPFQKVQVWFLGQGRVLLLTKGGQIIAGRATGYNSGEGVDSLE